MKVIFVVFGIAVVCIALAFAGIGIKMWLKKNGEFKRHCSSADPKTGKCAHCTCEKSEEDPEKDA